MSWCSTLTFITKEGGRGTRAVEWSHWFTYLCRSSGHCLQLHIFPAGDETSSCGPPPPHSNTPRNAAFLPECSLKLRLSEPASIPSSAVTKCCQCRSKARNFGVRWIRLTAKPTSVFHPRSQECVGWSEEVTSRSNQPGRHWTL